MKTIEEIFAKATDDIKVSLGSMFTKDDVINILTNIETVIAENEPSSPYPTAEDLDELEKNIINALNNFSSNHGNEELIDYDSAELSIDYNRSIQIDNIDINIGAVAGAIIEYITNK